MLNFKNGLAPKVTACLCLVFASIAAQASDVLYSYDAAGRMTGVVDQNGNAALYTYDAAGNITSTQSFAAGSLVVLGVVPNSGYTGQTVTISGIGFNPSAASDSVSFNGTAASIVSATANQLVVTVPAGASSGTITVNGQARSATAFTVVPTPPNATPAISGFSPASGGGGDTVTISGSNFSTSAGNETVAFGNVLGQIVSTSASSISVLVPPSGGSGPIVVTTQAGTAVSSGSFYVYPGGYNSSEVASTTNLAFNTTPANQSTSVNVTSSSLGYLFTFNGTAGQRASAAVLDGAYLAANVSLYAPDGSLVAGPIGSSYELGFGSTPGALPAPGALLGPVTLPLTGIYTIVVTAVNNATGPVQIAVYTVPADQTGALQANQRLRVNLAVPGQKGLFSLAPASNQVASALFFMTDAITELEFDLTSPSGALVDSFGPEYGLLPNLVASVVDPTTPGSAQPYGVRLLGDQADVYSGYLTYLAFPPAVTTSNTASGASVTSPSIQYSTDAEYYFQGTANQGLSLKLTAASVGAQQGHIFILSPSGKVVLSDTPAITGTYPAAGSFTLPESGVYTMYMATYDTTAGTLTYNLYAAPQDPVISSSLSGTAVTGSIATPGEMIDYTFSGTAGQTASGVLTTTIALASGCAQIVNITNPDGTLASVGNSGACGTLQGYFLPYVLPQTGTYRVRVGVTKSGTGNVALALYNVPADATVATTANGAQVTLSIPTPGQHGNVTFPGTSGQSVSLKFASGTISSSTFNLYRADGTTVVTSGSLGTASLTKSGISLPASETYKLEIIPNAVNTGSETLSVTSP